MTDDDPLEGADVGETRTVTREARYWAIDAAPTEFFGGDRIGGPRVKDVEHVPADEDGNLGEIVVTYEGELTKALPPRWDQCNEPRTEEERQRARRNRWLRRVGRALAVVLPVGLATGVSWVVFGAIEGSMTINSQPVQMPHPGMFGLLALAIVVLSVAVDGLMGDTF